MKLSDGSSFCAVCYDVRGICKVLVEMVGYVFVGGGGVVIEID